MGVSLYELGVVFTRDDRDERLHLASRKVCYRLPIGRTCVALPFVTVTLLEDHYRRNRVSSKLFAKLLIFLAVNGADLEYTVHLLGKCSILVLELLALLVAPLVKEDHPYLPPAIELEDLVQIQPDYVAILE